MKKWRANTPDNLKLMLTYNMVAQQPGGNWLLCLLHCICLQSENSEQHQCLTLPG